MHGAGTAKALARPQHGPIFPSEVLSGPEPSALLLLKAPLESCDFGPQKLAFIIDHPSNDHHRPPDDRHQLRDDRNHPLG